MNFYVGEFCYNLLARPSFGYQDNGFLAWRIRPICQIETYSEET